MKRFLLGLLMALPVLSFAQSNFQKGYVVTNAHDTIRGYINYREKTANPTAVQFRKAPDAKTQVFDLKNCAGYTIDGMESSRRFLVNISMDRTNIASLSIGLDSTSRRDTVFLKVLQSGKNITLFSYEDAVKPRFYIQEKGIQEPYELIRNLFLLQSASSTMATNNKYQGQIYQLMDRFNAGTETDKRNLKRLRYNTTELTKIAYLINGETAVKSKFRATRFFAGGGLSLTKASFQGDVIFADKSVKSKTSLAPVFDVGIDLFLNPAIGKFIFRTDLSFLMSKNEVSVNPGGERMAQTFDQKAFVITPQFIYNLYNRNTVKFFIGAGVSGNFSSYSNVVTSRTYNGKVSEQKDAFDPEKFNFSFPVTTGVVLNRKIELSFAYIVPTAMTNYVAYSASLQRFKFGVNYLFD